MKNRKLKRAYLAMGISLLLTACDGGGVFYDEPDKSSATDDKCSSNQATVNGTCVDVNIIDIKPLAIAINQLTQFTITSDNLPNDVGVSIEQCNDGKVISRSAANIKYQCKPTALGEKQLAIVQSNKIVYAAIIVVSDKKKIEVKATMPSNPDSTLIGVDKNTNGVRDEVELKLAEYIYAQDNFDKALISAKAYQDILKEPSPINRKEALAIATKISCETMKGFNIKNIKGDSINMIATFNSERRKEKYYDFSDALDGGIEGSELGKCQ